MSGASWSALLRLASVRSNEARRGVTGFGAFCRNKRASPAGAKPGNTRTSRGHESWGHTCEAFTCQRFFTWQPPRWIPDTHRQAVRPEPYILNDPLFRSAAISKSATAPPDAGFCPVISLASSRAKEAHSLLPDKPQRFETKMANDHHAHLFILSLTSRGIIRARSLVRMAGLSASSIPARGYNA